MWGHNGVASCQFCRDIIGIENDIKFGFDIELSLFLVCDK